MQFPRVTLLSFHASSSRATGGVLLEFTHASSQPKAQVSEIRCAQTSPTSTRTDLFIQTNSAACVDSTHKKRLKLLFSRLRLLKSVSLPPTPPFALLTGLEQSRFLTLCSSTVVI